METPPSYQHGIDDAMRFLQTVVDRMVDMSDADLVEWWAGFITTQIGAGVAAIGVERMVAIIAAANPRLIEIEH